MTLLLILLTIERSISRWVVGGGLRIKTLNTSYSHLKSHTISKDLIFLWIMGCLSSTGLKAIFILRVGSTRVLSISGTTTRRIYLYLGGSS